MMCYRRSLRDSIFFHRKSPHTFPNVVTEGVDPAALGGVRVLFLFCSLRSCPMCSSHALSLALTRLISLSLCPKILSRLTNSHFRLFICCCFFTSDFFIVESFDCWSFFIFAICRPWIRCCRCIVTCSVKGKVRIGGRPVLCARLSESPHSIDRS
jgi:hypothetical protein